MLYISVYTGGDCGKIPNHKESRRGLPGGGDREAVLGRGGGRRRELPGSRHFVKQVLRQWECGGKEVRPGYAGFDCFDKECEF